MDIIKDLGIELTKSGHKKRFVLARCDCGNTFKVALNSIKTGNTRSCGCYINRKPTLTSHPAYNLLKDIKSRCYNENREYYYLYGGAGIIVCDEWKYNSKSFLEWCDNNGYKRGLYIDRINPKGNYEPSNCRFVDAYINSVNTRLLSINNKSGFRGVSKHVYKNNVKWRSRIAVKNKKISLGVYNTKIEAANAYDNFVIKNKLPNPINSINKLK